MCKISPTSRASFRLQNALTGLVLAGFATAVWSYSIRAVKQDDFSNADLEARGMMMAKGRAETGSERHGDRDVMGVDVGRAVNPDPVPDTRPRGILALILDRAFPRLLDPTLKMLVWGKVIIVSGAKPTSKRGQLGYVPRPQGAGTRHDPRAQT